jgi:hypothetical protein
MQMRDRQRGATEMQRERGDDRKNPEPPRGLLFVEIRHRSSAVHSAFSREKRVKNKALDLSAAVRF